MEENHRWRTAVPVADLTSSPLVNIDDLQLSRFFQRACHIFNSIEPFDHTITRVHSTRLMPRWTRTIQTS